MKHKDSVSFFAFLISILIVASLVNATTLPVTITPENLVIRDENGNIIATSLTVALINNTDGYVQLARALTESGTVFPTTPAVGYLYYHTGIGALYIYNGSAWITALTATLPPGSISYNDLSDKPDLTVYLLQNATRPLTADWNTGAFGVYGLTYVNATAISANLYYINNYLVIDSARNGYFVNVNGTWVNATNIYFSGQFWYNGYNRTDMLAHPQDSFNFLVYSEGGIVYARTGNTWQVTPSTIQACVDAVTDSGGSIIVKNGTYSEAVSLKNATRLVLDRGCTGVTVSIASGATAILEDYNLAITNVWSSGVLVMQYNNINGAINGVWTTFTNGIFTNLNATYFFLGSLTSDPAIPLVGEMWYRSDLGQFRFYNGSTIVLGAGTVGPAGEAGVVSGLPFSYLVFKNATATYMVSGVTGSIDYSSTNVSKVINFAFGNLTTGGSVFLRAGTYSIDTTIVMGYSYQSLFGEGIATNITLANSANCNMINITGAGVKNVHLNNFALYGNKASESSGNGIYIDTSYVDWDACHIIENIHIRNCKDSGIYVTGTSATTRVIYMNKISIQMCDGRGIYLNATDCFLDDIEIGFSGLSGINTKTTSSKFSNVKTFACGQLGTSNDNSGWLLRGTNAACYCTFVNCVAEDNRYNGWTLYDGVRDNSFSSCWAKNNGASVAGWDGWNITTGCYKLQFSGCWAYDSRDNAYYQYNGFGCYGSCYELVFTGCQATGSDNTGLMLGNSNNCTVTGGLFNNNDNYGVEETSGADYNIIIGVSAMNNDVGGIATVGTNTKCKLSYDGITWLSDAGPGTTAYTNATRGIERYVILTDGSYTWAVDENGGILLNNTYANTNLVITAAFGNLTAARTWKEAVTIKGSYTGLSQILPPSYTIFQISGKLVAKNALNTDFIYATGKTQIDIIGGKIDGNKAGQTSDMSVIRFSTSTYCTVQYCEVTGGFRRDPVASYSRGEGIEFDTSSYCQASNNYVHDTDYDNIKLRDTTVGCIVTNNICQNSENSSNIQLAGDGTERNVISNNVLIRSDGGTMPVLANIKLHYADRNLIEGNQMYGTNPVSVIGSSDRNLFTNNYMYQTTDAGSAYIFNFYNGGFGENYDNVISDNYVYNCRKRFVQIDDGNRIQILDNEVISDTTASSHQAVYIASGVVDTRIVNNYFYGMEDGFSNAGTGTIYKDNYPSPYLSENTISLTNTTALSFVFNHGLISTATFVWCSFSTATVSGYTWTSTTTQITVTIVGTGLPSSITCYCKCEYTP